jgi:hypothetical protein
MRTFLDWETGSIPLYPLWLRMAVAAPDFGPTKKVVMRRPGAERLRAGRAPTLVLLAGGSRAHDIDRVETAARGLLRHVTTAVLSGASHHSLPAAQPADLNHRLVSFLT